MTVSDPSAAQSRGRIALAVTGSIAAFKAASLASLLVQDGHEVRVILSAGGARFVTPLTFEAITGNRLASDIWDESPGSSRMGHIDLARWAKVLVVAPASAGALSRLALGLTSDLLGSVALATEAPLVIAPAMEGHMWRHPATQSHVETLRSRGARIIGPASGRLASGAIDEGRLIEPEEIAQFVSATLRGQGSLLGKRVLVTAGPTYEPIDPVRFIGNRSSGKMGYAVAEEARRRGAEVLLVSGPTALSPPPGADFLPVESAGEMRDAVLKHAPHSDIVVMAAAIADFAPSRVATDKINRSEALSLELSPTEDIAASAVQVAPHAFHVGFALETDNLVVKGLEKLRRKGQRLVVANEVNSDHNPFGSDTNRVVLISEEEITELPQMSKGNVAAALWDRVEREISEPRRGDQHRTDHAATDSLDIF